MHSYNITHCIKHGVKHKVHQVQRKQIDSHKVCSECPSLARTQARKRVGQWSTVINQRLLQASPHMQQMLSQLINIMNVTVTSYLRQM